MKHLAPIDPHVHLRGSEYDINFIAKGLLNMKAAKLVGFIEMPNCTPNLVSGLACQARYKELRSVAYDVGCTDIQHGIHIGITKDPKQMSEVLALAAMEWAGISSVKIFFTHSTGNMGIMNPEDQVRFWKIAGETGFKGTVVGHYEDEQLFINEFNADDPVSQSHRQSEHAEVTQVERQLKLAHDAGFKGTLYVAHASSPMTVDLLVSEKRARHPFTIAIEATFHHLFLNWNDYNSLGNLVKMNPPLRTPRSQQLLLGHYLNGMIDTLGTDHAPHPLTAKKGKTPPSGIPTLPFWPRAIELLHGYGASKRLLEDTTFHNANRLFAMNLEPREVETTYDPREWNHYDFNPFQRLDNNTCESEN